MAVSDAVAPIHATPPEARRPVPAAIDGMGLSGLNSRHISARVTARWYAIEAMPDAAPDESPHISGLLLELLKTLIAPVVAGIAALLFYPFDWFASLISVLLVLACVLMARKAKRLRKIQQRCWPWRIGSTVAAFTALTWVAVFPVIGTKPIYVCNSSKTDWTGTFSEPLNANGRRVATLLFIADPIRKSQAFQDLIVRLAAERLRSVHAIAKEHHEYYEMPLVYALKKSVPTASAAAEAKEVTEVVYQGPRVGIGMTIVGRNLFLIESVGISRGPVVLSFRRKSTPWQIISVDGSEDDAFRYTARLDFALTAINEGDYSTALGLLEQAGVHAPSPLEKARTLIVMAGVTSLVLGNSIGALQGLSLYNEAFRTWHDAVSTAKPADASSASLEEWIKGELRAEFEQYGSAYPEVAKALALDPKSVQAAEALRFQKERGKTVAKPSEATAIFNSLYRQLRDYMSSDYARDWFEAESERLARLDSNSLMEEAKHAASRGPDEARWFAETLINLYAGGMTDSDHDGISSAVGVVADGCTEPWRSQFKEYLRTTREIGMTRSSSDSQAQLRVSVKSAERFGFKKTASMFQEILDTARSQVSMPVELRFSQPPPSAAWWTREYLDWFLPTMWTMISNSHGKCDVASPSCEDMLMSMRPYICFDGTENHRLFAPGLGLAMLMVSGEPKVDPYWDHAFYFGTGTHFALWQRGLEGSSSTRPVR
jgi:tetratricopeptide (TPR) repeat protein